MEHVRIRSLDVLIFANNRDNTVSSPQKSDVYRWDTTLQVFVLHERLETNRVEKVEVLTAFDDTGINVCLLVAALVLNNFQKKFLNSVQKLNF